VGEPILMPTSRGDWYEYSGADLESVKGWDEFRALMLVHLRETVGMRQDLSDVLVGHEQWMMLAKSMPSDMYWFAGISTMVMGVPIVRMAQADCLIFRHRRR